MLDDAQIDVMRTMIVAPGPPPSASVPIGTVTQAPDGTIVLNQRVDGAHGAIGDAQFRVALSDTDYPEVAKHVGPIPQDGSVLVKPFGK